jgi:hypothetical protein
MSGRIAPAVSAMGQAGVAFQLFYDYDPLADGDWPSGGASAQTVSLDRLPDACGARRRRDRCAFVFWMRDGGRRWTERIPTILIGFWRL